MSSKSKLSKESHKNSKSGFPNPVRPTESTSSNRDVQKTKQQRSESLGRQAVNKIKDQRDLRRTGSIDRVTKRVKDKPDNSSSDDLHKGRVTRQSPRKDTKERLASKQHVKQGNKASSSQSKKSNEVSKKQHNAKLSTNVSKNQGAKQSGSRKHTEISTKAVKSIQKGVSPELNTDKKLEQRRTFSPKKNVKSGNVVNSKLSTESSDASVLRPRTSTIRKSSTSDVNSNMVQISDLTSVIQKDDGKQNKQKSKTEVIASPSSEEAVYSYEDDFEEYESDFEKSESSEEPVEEYDDKVSESDPDESSSELGTSGAAVRSFPGIVQPTIVKQQVVKPPKIAQKKARAEFLKMSARSSTFLIDDSNIPPTDSSSLLIADSFIDFAAAIQKQEKKRQCSKVLKRGQELLELISLDEMCYDVLEIPPMPYELFIRSFGKLDSKQAWIQTENTEEEETQTDDIEMFEKWTQYPPFDNLGVGGDGLFEEHVGGLEMHNLTHKTHSLKVQRFLHNVGPVIFTILNESVPSANLNYLPCHGKSVDFSQGHVKLQPVPICEGVPVIYLSYSTGPPLCILSVHGKFSEEENSVVIGDEKGLMCIWNISQQEKPEHMLASNSQPTCACFGPNGHDVVMAGMVDGSLMLWDLAESAALHQSYTFKKNEVIMRSPTYNTAALLEESHKSCVVALQVFHHPKRHVNSFKDMGTSRNEAKESCSLLSLDEMGVLNIWAVVEICKKNAYTDDDDFDLGLAPGGRMKIIWSSSISLNGLHYVSENLRSEIRTFDLKILPSGDKGHVLVTTDFDQVLHFNHSGHTISPRCYTCEAGFPNELRCIACSPHAENYFLVGGSNGSVMLFRMERSTPVKTISQAASGESVTNLQWSCTHPAIFYVLGSSSSFHIWDLSKDASNPQLSCTFKDPKLTWFCVYDFHKRKTSKSRDDAPSQIALTKENGEIEIHALHWEFDAVSEKEYNAELDVIQNL